MYDDAIPCIGGHPRTWKASLKEVPMIILLRINVLFALEFRDLAIELILQNYDACCLARSM